MIKKVLFVLLVVFACNSANSQTMHDAFLRSQHLWGMAAGITVGEPSGFEIQVFNTRKRSCSNFIKHHQIGFYGVYEGLAFNKSLKDKYLDWEKGGIRLGLDYNYYFNLRLHGHGFFIGAGAETGTRNFIAGKENMTDITASAGFDLKLLTLHHSRSNTTYLTALIKGKYNYCLNDDFSYVLPTVGLLWMF